jgi:hypothetical protein
LKRAIYVDYENVSLGGLAGIEKLTGDDLVQIFIGSKSQKLSMEDADRIFNCEAEIEVITNKYIGKNALDFIIMVHMGHDIALNVAKEYYIISKDKGYDPAIHEMRKMSGLTVSRRNEITSVADEKNTIGKKIMGIFGIGKDKGPEEPDTTEHTFVKGKGKNKKPLVTNKQTDGQKAEDGIKSDYEKPHADDDRQQVNFSKKKQRPRKSNQSAKAFNSDNGSQLEKKQTEKGKQLEKAHNSNDGSQLEKKQTEKGKQLEKAHNSDNGSQLEKTFSSELGNQSAENHQIAKSKKSKKKRTISKKTVDNPTDKNEADNSQNSDKKSVKAKQANDKPVEKTKQANDKPVEKNKKPAAKKQAEKPKQSATEKQAEKPQQPAAKKQAEKPQQPAAKKQAEKPQQPAAKKQAEKPQQPAAKKQAEKPQQPAAKKQAEKPQQPAAKKQAEKPQQPAAKKQAEKPQQPAAKKQAEKPQQPATKKQAEKPQQTATEKQEKKLQQSDSDNVTKRAQKPKKKSRPANRQADNSKLESTKNADNKAFSTKESSVSNEAAGVLNEADKQQRYEDHKQAMMKAAQQNQSSKVSITPQQEKKSDNSLQPELSPEELERKKSRDEAFALLAMLDEEENSRPKFVYKRK